MNFTVAEIWDFENFPEDDFDSISSPTSNCFIKNSQNVHCTQICDLISQSSLLQPICKKKGRVCKAYSQRTLASSKFLVWPTISTCILCLSRFFSALLLLTLLLDWTLYLVHWVMKQHSAEKMSPVVPLCPHLGGRYCLEISLWKLVK